MHGLGGNKDQPMIKAIVAAFTEQGCTVVRFDTTNTFGESDGNHEHATTTNYYEDLQDVILWAKKQSWYKGPFWLCGHSLGGLCVLLFAEEHPDIIKGLAPIACVVSAQLSMKSPKYSENNLLEEWKKSGWGEEKSNFQQGRVKRLPW